MAHGIPADIVALTKKRLRSTILVRIKSQKEEDRDRKSRRIKAKLLQSPLFKRARAVMFYIALPGEVDTNEMIKAAKKLGKIVTVPVCQKDRESMKPCMLDDHGRFKRGPYGVPEPIVERFLSPSELDLVVVPGLAFDKQGNRLGRGKGCYDRFLRLLPRESRSIGLAFDFQVLPVVPAAPHDVSVDRIICA